MPIEMEVPNGTAKERHSGSYPVRGDGSPTAGSVVSQIKIEGSKWDCTNWDLNTQQPHGGQEWATMDNFVEDFSVTTNTLGPPWKAVAAATAALSEVEYAFHFYVSFLRFYILVTACII
jgi:hypothetical protein